MKKDIKKPIISLVARIIFSMGHVVHLFISVIDISHYSFILITLNSFMLSEIRSLFIFLLLIHSNIYFVHIIIHLSQLHIIQICSFVKDIVN